MLKVEGLYAGYGKTTILRNITIEAKEGELIGLIGANGVGKTSLFRAIAGLIPITTGSVIVAGVDISTLRPHRIARLGVGQVPEGRRVFSKLSVYDNLLVAAKYGGRLSTKKTMETFQEVYDLFPVLKEIGSRLAGTLSGGQQQMVAIGRALMLRPKLLLMDEPSLGLAPLIVGEVFAKIKSLNEMGKTIFLIEQNAHHALNISQRAYVLKNGAVSMHGTAKEILASGIAYDYLGTKKV